MKILQIINAPVGAKVIYKDGDGESYVAPVVCLGLVTEDEITYVMPFVGGADGDIKDIDRLDIEEVIWNG